MRQLSNVNADGYKQRNLNRECCWLLAATEEWKTRQRTRTHKSSGESIVKYTKLATRNQYPPEEKIKIVLDALYGEDNIAELYCSEGISQGIYYKQSKDFMEAGKSQLAGDIARAERCLRLHR